MKQVVRVDGWAVVVSGYRLVPSFGGQAHAVGSSWLVVDVTVTNEGTRNRQLSPDILEVGYQLHTEGYSSKGPDRGIASSDEVAATHTVRRAFCYVVPDGANGFVVLFRAGVGSEEAHGRAAEISLSCC